jgi:hypothetical protein
VSPCKHGFAGLAQRCPYCATGIEPLGPLSLWRREEAKAAIDAMPAAKADAIGDAVVRVCLLAHCTHPAHRPMRAQSDGVRWCPDCGAVKATLGVWVAPILTSAAKDLDDAVGLSAARSESFARDSSKKTDS